MSGRTKASRTYVGAGTRSKAARTEPRPSTPAPASPNPERTMSVEDFRRLVQELYLEPGTRAAKTRLQTGPGAIVHNAAILVDTSGSMEHADPQLAKLKGALAQFAAQLAVYAAREIQLKVCLIGFSEKITAFFAVENFTEFASRPEDPFYAAIHALRAGGGTNYQAAFHKAGAWFAGHANEQASNAIFFITDGRPTCYYHDAFTHSIASSKSGAYIYNGTEFLYGGKGRVYYDANGFIVGNNSGVRRYRASEDGLFEVRVGSSMNWSEARAVFVPDSPARRVSCTLPEYYVPGQPHYFDASGNNLPDAKGAVYRMSASGNFEQYRRGAWYEPAGAVIATALDNGGIAHPSLTTKVQGGSGVSSGMLEAGKSLRACREIMAKVRRLSIYAIGIGSGVDSSMLNSFDTAAHARILPDTGQLAAVLADAAHSGFSAILPGLQAESPPDVLRAPGRGTEAGSVPQGAPHQPAMAGEADGRAVSFHGDGSMLSGFGGDLPTGGSESAIGSADSPASAGQVHVAVVRHFYLGNDHLDLRDLFGEDATVDHLLPRIAASQETRIVNGENFEDLVLRIHAGNDAMTPVVQTIVLEDFARLNPEASLDDLPALLHRLLQI